VLTNINYKIIYLAFSFLLLLDDHRRHIRAPLSDPNSIKHVKVMNKLDCKYLYYLLNLHKFFGMSFCIVGLQFKS